MAKIKTFFGLPRVTQLLFLEALFLLPLCQCCVKFLHLKNILKLFKLRPFTGLQVAGPQAKDTVNLVGWVIYKALSIPGPRCARCLAQALTARILLRQRGEKSVLTIGAAIGEQTMAAHAWLHCGDMVVTGRQEKERFIKVASYS